MPDNPIARAPAGVKSIIRPRIKGPRSLMRTTTDRPVRIFVTCTLVPKGNLRCAAVNPDAGAYSPLAVLPPLYTDAIPVWGSAITGEENEIPARKIKAPAAQARPCIHAPSRIGFVRRQRSYGFASKPIARYCDGGESRVRVVLIGVLMMAKSG